MLISEPELRAALEPLLDRLLSERLRIFQLQLEPRIQSLVQAALAPEAAHRAHRALAEILAAANVNACFELFFAHAGTLVGEAHALLVTWQEETAVWKQQQMALPERFPSANQDLTLRGLQRRSLQVRGREIGTLVWRGDSLDAVRAAELDLMLKSAELALLALALPPPATPAAIAVLAEIPAARAVRGTGPTQAHRFAALLLEDLALYLEHEHRAPTPDEVERCRRAFSHRFPGEPISIFEEELPRLAG